MLYIGPVILIQKAIEMGDYCAIWHHGPPGWQRLVVLLHETFSVLEFVELLYFLLNYKVRVLTVWLIAVSAGFGIGFEDRVGRER